MKIKKVSDLRTELMGIATLGVLLAHTISIVSFPKTLEGILTYGNCAVYIFAFLSGFGLYFSLSTSTRLDRGGILLFYKKRVERLILPYLFLSCLWYGTRYLVLEFDFLNFFYELSLFSFWMEHRGAWYVAMSIILYAIYPLYYYCTVKAGIEKSTAVSIVFVLGLGALIELYNPEVYSHLSKVLNSFIAALIGTFVAYWEQRGKNCYLGAFIGAGSYFFVMQMIPRLKQLHFLSSMKNLWLGVSLTYIALILFLFLDWKFIRTILKNIGNYSLELYLSNIYLIQLYVYLTSRGMKIVGIPMQLVCYLIIVITGVGLSVLSRIFLKNIKRVKRG